MRLVLRDAAPPAARDELPRRARRLAPGDRARCRRESRASDVGWDLRASSRSASSTPSAPPSAYPRSRALARQPTPALAGRGRRGARRGRVGALLVRPVRGRLAAPLLRPLPRVGRRRPRRRDHDPRLHRVRLLQPLVAVRLDAGHVGRAARCDVRRHRVPSSSSRCSTSIRRRSRAGSGSSTSCSCSRSSWACDCSRGRSSSARRHARSWRGARRC